MSTVASISKDSMQHLVTHGARILVLGDRGVGKSSLINAAFGQKVAETGVGLSVTQDITLCPGRDAKNPLTQFSFDMTAEIPCSILFRPGTGHRNAVQCISTTPRASRHWMQNWSSSISWSRSDERQLAGITWRIHGESLSNCMQCGG